MTCHAACCVDWETGEDDSDDHSEAEMGGEPRPTGRANLFDTRKTSKTPWRKEEGSVFLSCAGEWKRKHAGVPVYRSTQKERGTETSISLISLEKQNYKFHNKRVHSMAY